MTICFHQGYYLLITFHLFSILLHHLVKKYWCHEASQTYQFQGLMVTGSVVCCVSFSDRWTLRLSSTFSGWWFQLWKIIVSWDDEIPNIWENKKCSKPPISSAIRGLGNDLHIPPRFVTSFSMTSHRLRGNHSTCLNDSPAHLSRGFKLLSFCFYKPWVKAQKWGIYLSWWEFQ